jgi:tetratricopeptide (TPR) repeat protein
MNFSTSYINDVNSRAVLLLQQNRHMDAICWLRRGLRNLASLEHLTYDAHDQQNVYTHHASLKCVDSMDMDVKREQRLAYSANVPAVRDTIMSDSPDNVFVVFHRAFLLSDYGELSASVNSTIASATLLYNMGLAWHQLGAQENNTAALKKALFAYEMAYSALSQQSQQQGNDNFSYLVMLALCNNMAHVHFHFSNLEKAKKCRDLIPQILACSSPGIYSMATDDYDFFLSEAMLLKGQCLKFAPAA